MSFVSSEAVAWLLVGYLVGTITKSKYPPQKILKFMKDKIRSFF